MCTHARLGSQGNTPNSQNGKDTRFKWGEMLNDLVHKIMEACCVYPHGVLRLLEKGIQSKKTGLNACSRVLEYHINVDMYVRMHIPVSIYIYI